ncbi:MAG: nuclear transport factor 2 family protein [Lachnospiraceae bacterium]|nr:nuclear transport factor 2 family protein [Lachnospiraceae bacterium]
MDEEQRIKELYREMYRHMISKDMVLLSEILDENFVLVHMTGMRQSKSAFLNAVANGTLNYYSEEPDRIAVKMMNDTAELTGESRVMAAVFGGGPGNWHLRLKINLKKKDNCWLMTRAVASTY